MPVTLQSDVLGRILPENLCFCCLPASPSGCLCEFLPAACHTLPAHISLTLPQTVKHLRLFAGRFSVSCMTFYAMLPLLTFPVGYFRRRLCGKDFLSGSVSFSRLWDSVLPSYFSRSVFSHAFPFLQTFRQQLSAMSRGVHKFFPWPSLQQALDRAHL